LAIGGALFQIVGKMNERESGGTRSRHDPISLPLWQDETHPRETAMTAELLIGAASAAMSKRGEMCLRGSSVPSSAYEL